MTTKWRRLAPLLLATMASQSMLVVLGPTIVAIAEDLEISVSTTGQARSITAAVSVTASLFLMTHGAQVSLRGLLAIGSLLAVLASGAVAVAWNGPMFLLAHVLVGLGFACLLSGGFAGAGAFPPTERPWAMGYVASSNAIAWILVTPLAAWLADASSWRAAQVLPAALALVALLVSRDLPQASGPSPVHDIWAPLRRASPRRWLLAELTGFAAWTGLLTYAGAFLIDELGTSLTLAGWLLAMGAASYVVSSTQSGWLTARLPPKLLAAGSALGMAALLPVMLAADSVGGGTALFCAVGFVAGIRTPASASLGLSQLPGNPAAMAAARTAATQLGYLVGALLGGLVIAREGYEALGVLLALVMALSAVLVLRVSEPTGVYRNKLA